MLPRKRWTENWVTQTIVTETPTKLNESVPRGHYRECSSQQPESYYPCCLGRLRMDEVSEGVGNS